jgi:Fe-coproporphyrin III synthase
VLSAAQLRANLLVKLGEWTARTHALPMVLFAPTARCNSRCVSCDWWRASGESDLTLPEIERLAADLAAIGTRVVVLTGGEPLVRADVMQVADLFLSRGLTLQLLTSGLALERHAADIGRRFTEVTISLDGHTPELYRQIRGVDGLALVSAGVQKLRQIAPGTRVRARSTLHRHNFRFLPDLIDKAAALGLDQISFLAADVTSDAFNRTTTPLTRLNGARRSGMDPAELLSVTAGASKEPAEEAPAPARSGGDAPAPAPASATAPVPPQLLLEPEEVAEFDHIVEATIAARAGALARGFIAQDAEGLRRLVRYYRAQLGMGSFPPVDCNAPWMSVMIEASGDVRPCFFHPAVGNLRQRPLADLLGIAMPTFRRRLRVADDPTCQRCVCTLKVGLRTRLW